MPLLSFFQQEDDEEIDVDGPAISDLSDSCPSSGHAHNRSSYCDRAGYISPVDRSAFLNSRERTAYINNPDRTAFINARAEALVERSMGLYTSTIYFLKELL